MVRASSFSLAALTDFGVEWMLRRAFFSHHSTCRSNAFTPKQRSQCGHCSETGGAVRFDWRIGSRLNGDGSFVWSVLAFDGGDCWNSVCEYD